jgi:hypothetical protein
MEIFSKKEVLKLNSIIKLIIPEGNTRMPNAEFILNSIDLKNSSHVNFVNVSKEICDLIGMNQINTEDDLNKFKKNFFRNFSVFVNTLLKVYYSNETVLSKLEVGSIPPFPEGNYVKEGDIYLLEQVFLKEKIYKD